MTPQRPESDGTVLKANGFQRGLILCALFLAFIGLIQLTYRVVPTRANAKYFTRAYDVRDITGPMSEQLKRGSWSGKSVLPSSVIAVTVFTSPGGKISAPPPPRPAESEVSNYLGRSLMNFTESGWYEFGGGEGQICSFDGILIVRQTNEGHRQIRRLLSLIRQVGKSDSTGSLTRNPR